MKKVIAVSKVMHIFSAITPQDDLFFQKYKKLNEALVGIVQEYGLVTFTLLDVQVNNLDLDKM